MIINLTFQIDVQEYLVRKTAATLAHLARCIAFNNYLLMFSIHCVSPQFSLLHPTSIFWFNHTQSSRWYKIGLDENLNHIHLSKHEWRKIYNLLFFGTPSCDFHIKYFWNCPLWKIAIISGNAQKNKDEAIMQVGHGDCDIVDDCDDSLTCGENNCRRYNPLAKSDADCCQSGKE